MRIRWMRAVAACGFVTVTVRAQVTQSRLGPELLGTGATQGQGFSAALQGWGVAISGDGNTAMSGAPYDSQGVGATWAWARQSDGTWAQQGAKMVASGSVSGVQEGFWMALSYDGNTAVVGGPGNTQVSGAAYVWTRSNGVWTQQGSGLPGGGPVAISSDGNTVVVGEPGLNSETGGVAIWTRSNGVWTQQGSALTGSNPGTQSGEGRSVAISGDGQTVAFGAPSDDSVRAVWVFTVSNGAWTQQGAKIVPVSSPGGGGFGQAVALSSDGNTLLVGQPSGSTELPGDGWIYTRTGGAWSEAAELSGNGTGPARHGS